MKRAFAIADSTALFGMKLLAAVNLLFFLSFLAVLMFAA
jgi:hypothetical protein